MTARWQPITVWRVKSRPTLSGVLNHRASIGRSAQRAFFPRVVSSVGNSRRDLRSLVVFLVRRKINSTSSYKELFPIMYTISKGPSQIVAKTRRGERIFPVAKFRKWTHNPFIFHHYFLKIFMLLSQDTACAAWCFLFIYLRQITMCYNFFIIFFFSLWNWNQSVWRYIDYRWNVLLNKSS